MFPTLYVPHSTLPRHIKCPPRHICTHVICPHTTKKRDILYSVGNIYIVWVTYGVGAMLYIAWVYGVGAYRVYGVGKKGRIAWVKKDVSRGYMVWVHIGYMMWGTQDVSCGEHRTYRVGI